MAAKENLLKRQRLMVYDHSQVHGIEDLKQEVSDALIAARAAYEPTSDGAAQVLSRRFRLQHTGSLELIHHRSARHHSPRPTTSSSTAICNVDSCEYIKLEAESHLDHRQQFLMARSSNGYIIVACRGTFSLSDIVQDAKLAKTRVPFASKGRAHIGFLERALSLPIHLFLALLRSGEKLLFTGHSLGGAVASLATIHVLEAIASVPSHDRLLPGRVRCITFGTAPFANLELARHVNSRYRDFFHNVVSKNDIIPRCHNLVGQVLFPAAKWFAETMNNVWEVMILRQMAEKALGMSLIKAANVAEERVEFLWPATRMFKFIVECAAENEEAICCEHCGYLLLLDREARDPRSASISLQKMESLGRELIVDQGKSFSEMFWEHGLANHYEGLVNNLLSADADRPAGEETMRKCTWYDRKDRAKCYQEAIEDGSVKKTSSLTTIFSSRLILDPIKNAMLRVVGNDFY